jgi:hypothetical protein
MRRRSLWSQVITNEDKQMRLGWRGLLFFMLGIVVLGIPFVYWGKFNLALPSFVSAAMIVLAVAMRWKLRRRPWFWITMGFLAAIHQPLIVFVPWTTKWIPAVVIAPFGMLDLHAMLWTLAVVGKHMEGLSPAEM